MAKNWSIAEAVEAIESGDKSSIQDIGKRFPLASNLLSQITGVKAFRDFAEAIPEHVTARKVEMVLSDGVSKFEEPDEEEASRSAGKESKASAEDSKTKAAPVKTKKVEDEGLVPIEECTKKAEAMSYTAGVLWNYLKDNGVPAKERGKGKDGHAEAVAKLNRKLAKAGGSASSKEESAEEANEQALEGKTVKELYVIAKDMGLEPEPKKGKKYYLELIAAGPGELEEEDDWDEDDDPEVEEAPKTKAKTSKAKAAKKVEEPEDEDDEDEDDWEI